MGLLDMHKVQISKVHQVHIAPAYLWAKIAATSLMGLWMPIIWDLVECRILIALMREGTQFYNLQYFILFDQVNQYYQCLAIYRTFIGIQLELEIMSMTTDRSQQTKIITLGKSNRQPLTTISKTNTVIAPLYAPSIPNQNIQPLVPPICPSQSSPSFRILRQYIGRPFEIRIPTTQLNYLQKQVKQLSSKCCLLQNQLKNKQNKEKQDIQNACIEISKSTKMLQEHLQNITNGSNTREDKFLDRCGEFSQFHTVISNEQMEQTIPSRVQELEQRNKQLQLNLAITKKQLETVILENIQLKRRIEMSTN